MHEDKIRKLEQCVLFRDCPAELIRSFVQDPDVHAESYRQGEYLMRRGGESHQIGVLLKGYAAVERKCEDGMMHMSRLQPSSLYGAASVFSGNASYMIDIRALRDCTALLISEEVLVRWMLAHPQILQNYLKYLTDRIRFLNQRLDALSKNTVPAMLMSFFLSESQEGVVNIKSYSELADSLCLSRATLYRALDTLSAEGKILRQGKQIILLEDTQS
ncbi:MAG: Crp/Fnr family transcriptional regulator [Clostridia bacterium]|nr:Crp/Fnr family transcriptional regulator [Clostridia bacterium]